MPVFEHSYHPNEKMGPLEKCGPVISVRISIPSVHEERLKRKGEPIPQPIDGYALIDTGTRMTSVDENICKKMELPEIDTVQVIHAGGTGMSMKYAAGLKFDSSFNHQTMQFVLGCKLDSSESGIIMLLGRDLLKSVKFIYNGLKNRVEISY